MDWPLTRERAFGFPWYPVALVAAYVLTLWIDSGVSFMAIWRALAVSVLGVGIALGLLASLTRRPHLSATIVVAAVGVLISRGAMGLAGMAVLFIAVPAALVTWARIRGAPTSLARMSTTLNILSLFVLAVVLMGAIPRGTYGALATTDIHQGANQLPPAHPVRDSPPSILVLLLDGYPRADALEAGFGHDNAAFLSELEERGFRVAAQSTSNYPYTQATLISMLHMRPLDEISALDAVETGEEAPFPRMRQVANNNPVFDELRKQGYRIVTSSPGYEHVTLRQADVFLDNGSLNEPERHLIRGTTIQSVIDMVNPQALADQHRQRIISSLEYADEVVDRLPDDGPIFAFLHVPSPHMPVVLGADGQLLKDPPSDAEFRAIPVPRTVRDAYIGQLTYLNERALGAIDAALETGPGKEPVIILMSDHGAAPPARPGESWAPDHYANFLAIRTPAPVEMDLPADMTPVNLFPRLFGALFGGEYREWPDEPYAWVDVPLPEGAGE